MAPARPQDRDLAKLAPRRPGASDATSRLHSIVPARVRFDADADLAPTSPRPGGPH